MDTLLQIIQCLAYSVSFCVLVVNLRMMLTTYLPTKLNNWLEIERIHNQTAIAVTRDPWREIA